MKTSETAPSETERVTEIIRNEIIDGVRKPGSRLVERELAQDLGVSRVPIREALKLLATEGLVTSRPNTWSTVREFTPSDIADLNEVREAFEVMAFELAAQRHTREGLAELETVVRRGQEAADNGNAIEAHRAAADFHETVTELAGNELLREIGRFLSPRLRWQLGQHDDLSCVAEEHAQLYEAVARRDAGQMRDLVLSHLQSSQQRHMEHLSREASRAG